MPLLPLLLLAQSMTPQAPAIARYDFPVTVGASGDFFGASVVDVGDWDADGVGDYAVGSPLEEVGAGPDTVDAHGRVRVYSGRSGDLIATTGELFGESGARLGESIAGGFDSDEDGRPELAASATGREEVLVFELGAELASGELELLLALSSSDTSALDEQGFGETVVNVGDVTGDDIPDLAIGAPSTSRLQSGQSPTPNVGSVRLFSGTDYGEVGRYSHGDAQQHYGRSIASVIDRSGNGIRDLMIGGPGNLCLCSTEIGRVYFVDPLQTTSDPLLISVTDGVMGGGFGHSVADVGDITGGTLSEFLVGKQAIVSGEDDIGGLTMFEGNTFQPLWTRGERKLELNPADIELVDVDGDGIREVISMETSTPTSLPALAALDLLSGATRYRYETNSLNDRSLWSVAIGVDVDQNGRNELVVGLPELSNVRGGVVTWEMLVNPLGLGFKKVWRVDQSGNSGDFEGLAQAMMVADGNDTIELVSSEFGYGISGTMRSAEILGIPNDAGIAPSITILRAVSVGSLWMQGVSCSFPEVRATSGRVTFEDCSILRLTVLGCSDVTVGNSEIGVSTGFSSTISDSRVELRSVEVIGADSDILAGGAQAVPPLVVEQGSEVLLTDFRVEGGDGSTTNPDLVAAPGCRLQTGSTLRLRGWAGDALLGGAFPFASGTFAPGVDADSSCTVFVSTTHDPVDINGAGTITSSIGATPWLEYEADPRVGNPWPLTYHDDTAAMGALFLSLLPDAAELPSVQGTPVWIDANAIVSTSIVAGSGGSQTPSVTFQLPTSPALVGLALHVQAFALGSSPFEGTNGGEARIR